jgi:hypothetical protein
MATTWEATKASGDSRPADCHSRSPPGTKYQVRPPAVYLCCVRAAYALARACDSILNFEPRTRDFITRHGPSRGQGRGDAKGRHARRRISLDRVWSVFPLQAGPRQLLRWCTAHSPSTLHTHALRRTRSPGCRFLRVSGVTREIGFSLGGGYAESVMVPHERCVSTVACTSVCGAVLCALMYAST